MGGIVGFKVASTAGINATVIELSEGASDGQNVGTTVETEVVCTVGDCVTWNELILGLSDGASVGALLGACNSDRVGSSSTGACMGASVGCGEGAFVGLLLGALIGILVATLKPTIPPILLTSQTTTEIPSKQSMISTLPTAVPIEEPTITPSKRATIEKIGLPSMSPTLLPNDANSVSTNMPANNPSEEIRDPTNAPISLLTANKPSTFATSLKPSNIPSRAPTEALSSVGMSNLTRSESDAFTKEENGNVVNLKTIFEDLWQSLETIACDWGVISWFYVILTILFLMFGILSFIVLNCDCCDCYACCCLCASEGSNCGKIDDFNFIFVCVFAFEIANVWSNFELVYEIITCEFCQHYLFVLAIILVILLLVAYFFNLIYCLLFCFYFGGINSKWDHFQNEYSLNWFQRSWNLILLVFLTLLNGNIFITMAFINSKLFGLDCFTFGLSNIELFAMSQNSNIFLKIYIFANCICYNALILLFDLTVMLTSDWYDNHEWIFMCSFVTSVISMLCFFYFLIVRSQFSSKSKLVSFYLFVYSDDNKYNCCKMAEFCEKRKMMQEFVRNNISMPQSMTDGINVSKMECPFVYQIENAIVIKVVILVKTSSRPRNSVDSNKQFVQNLSKSLIENEQKYSQLVSNFAHLFDIFDPTTIELQIQE